MGPAWAARVLERVRAARPAITVDEESFLAHVADCAERSSREPEHLHVEDLWLAFGCARRCEAAIAQFDRELAPQLIAALERVFSARADVEDAAQRIRERLLVGPPPRVLEYAGSGPLGGWLRVAALRTALNDERSKDARARAERGAAQEEWGLVDPELELLRRRYTAELDRAVKLALAKLDAEQRHLLRLHHLDGVPLAKLAKMHQVDASTLSRRVARARESVLAWTREALEHELSLSPATAASLIRVLKSRIDLSFSVLRSRR